MKIIYVRVSYLASVYTHLNADTAVRSMEMHKSFKTYSKVKLVTHNAYKLCLNLYKLDITRTKQFFNESRAVVYYRRMLRDPNLYVTMHIVSLDDVHQEQ